VSANLGMGILKQFNLTFDYARQRLILKPNHLYGQPDAFNRGGMRLAAIGDGWKVAEVMAGGAAAGFDVVVLVPPPERLAR
jgi:hypothetical protein